LGSITVIVQLFPDVLYDVEVTRLVVGGLESHVHPPAHTSALWVTRSVES
jgi:hypothetical protein